MQNDVKNERCVAVIGSMTRAMRAQSVLATSAIRAEVIKVDSGKTGQGCAYGIAFSCYQEENVKRILQRVGIRVRAFYGESL